MVQLSKFQPKDLKFKPIKDYAINQVPKIWGGYVALFEPYSAPMKTGFYSAYWFALKSGYYIQKALYIIPNE